MNSAKRGAPRSSANRLPCAPARTERPDLDSGSMARNALCLPGLTGNSMTVATDGSSEARRPDGAGHPERSGHLGREERPQALPADAPHQLADEPAERDAVVAVPRARLPGGLAAGDGGGDRLGVLPAAPVPRQQPVGARHADGARTGDSAAAARWWTTCRPGRTRASSGSTGASRSSSPRSSSTCVHSVVMPLVDDMMTARVSSSHARPSGPAGPVQMSTTHSPSTKAQKAPPPSPRSARRSLSPKVSVAPAASNVSATRSKPGATNPLTSDMSVTAPAAPARRRATSPCATTTR